MNVSTRPLARSSFPWRQLATVAVMLALIAASLAIWAGAQHRHVPSPFGVAANGLVAFADADGNIVTADPTTGKATTLIPGPGNERPIYSPDGTRLVYLHKAQAGGYDLVVTDAAVADPRTISPIPLTMVGFLGWTPQGDSVVVNELDQLSFYDPTVMAPARALNGPDGTPIIVPDHNAPGFNAQLAGLFRPPSRRRAPLIGSGDDPLAPATLLAVRRDGSAVRSLIDASDQVAYVDVLSPVWSPDGSMIVVTLLLPNGNDNFQVYVMNADGTGLRPLAHDGTTPHGDQPGLVTRGLPDRDAALGTSLRWIDRHASDHGRRRRDRGGTRGGGGLEQGLPQLGLVPGWEDVSQVPDADAQVVVQPIGAAQNTQVFGTWTAPTGASWQRTAP